MGPRVKTLSDVRFEILAVNSGPMAHNIVGIILRMTAKKFGRGAANKLVRDLKLTEKYGIMEA